MASGSVVKGSTSAAFMRKSVASVPTKFESVVYLGDKKKGFGSNSERFFGSYFGKPPATETSSQIDVPGPGSYLN